VARGNKKRGFRDITALFSWAKEAELKPDELSKFVLRNNKYGEIVLHGGARNGNVRRDRNKKFSWLQG
jgi:hypothetical protein